MLLYSYLRYDDETFSCTFKGTIRLSIASTKDGLFSNGPGVFAPGGAVRDGL